MPIRAMLFDFDGTLADSYRAITASVNHVRERHGLSALSVEQVRPNVGRGLPYLLEELRAGYGSRSRFPTLSRPSSKRHGRRHGSSSGGDDVVAVPARTHDQARDLLEQAGIVHSSPDCDAWSGQLFDQILGPEDVPSPKPAPDMLIEAIRRLDTPPSDAVYVGDMTVDIQTARGAGVRVWVVPTGSDTRDALFGRQARSLVEWTRRDCDGL